MQDPADRLTVQGGATFAGGVTTGRLTAGELRLAGDFRQQYVGSNWAAFAPSGSHRVILDGAADQTVQFDSPAGAPGQASFFHGLSLSKPSDVLTLLSTVPVNGVFEAAGQTVMGGGNALSVAGLNAVDNLILDHVLFTIGAGPVSGFDNVTFQNYAITATQLTVARPGGTFTFTGLRFLTTPTTGYYVSATDLAPADGDVLTINLTDAVPADGSALTLTSGGAVVTWAGAPVFAVMDQGLSYGCGLTTAGTAYCWGANAEGKLGDGTTTQRTAPTAVAGGLTFTDITAGGQHSCALDPDGLAYCWGSNAYGQLGDGSTTDRLTPVAVVGGLSYSAIAAGEQFTCAVQASTGLLYCWGRNTYGQLGDGTTTDRATLGPVEGVEGLVFGSVSAAIGQHACAVTTDGDGYCWGRNTNGQLGDGTSTNQLTPVAISGGLTFSMISATANEHTCGVTTGGQAWCWGWNNYGEVGDGTTTKRLAPVAVSGGLTFATVSGGANGFTCGLTTAGAGYCWGLNNVGQLGDGTTTARLTPVAVAGGLTFLQLSAGFAHVSAVATGGTGYAWGANTQGQLGDGTTTNRNVPTALVPPVP
jgi:alpha-tubulin suppressor-like RCC1 family protein